MRSRAPARTPARFRARRSRRTSDPFGPPEPREPGDDRRGVDRDRHRAGPRRPGLRRAGEGRPPRRPASRPTAWPAAGPTAPATSATRRSPGCSSATPWCSAPPGAATMLETQYEGLVFGRLDLEHDVRGNGGTEREVRYIGRLGVRDDEYEPLVIDWRAPAAAAVLPRHPGRADGRAAPPGAALQGRRRGRCRGRPDGARGARRPRRGRRRRADGGADPHPRRPHARHRRHHPAPPGRGDPGARRAASPRSPAAPAPARPSSPCTARPTCSTPTGAASRPAASSSSAPPRAYTAYIERVLPSLGEETVTLRSLGDVVDGVTTARLDPPAVGGDQGLACASGGCWRAPPRDRRAGRPDAVPGVRRRAGGPARAPARSTGCAPRCCAPPAQPRRPTPRAGPRPRRRGPRCAQGDASRVPRHVRGPRGRRGVHGGVVAPGRPARGAAVAGRPRPPAPLRRRRALREEVDVLAASIAGRARDRHVVGGRRRAHRRPRRPARRRRRRRRARSAASTRSRSSTTSPSTASPRCGRRYDAPQGTARGYEVAPPSPRERLLRGRLEAPAEYAHVLVDEAQDLSPMQWRMLGRRGRCVVVDGRRRRRPGRVAGRRRGRAGPVRRRSAASSARCSTWTPTTATPARSSTTPPPSSAPRCPTPTSRRRCGRPGSSHAT